MGAAGDLGIKDDFKQRVQDLIQPGTSALLVIMRKATPDKTLAAPRRRTGADEGPARHRPGLVRSCLHIPACADRRRPHHMFG